MANKFDTVFIDDICKMNQKTYSNNENWEYVNYLDTGSITANKIDDIQWIDLSIDKLPSRARRKVQDGNIVYSTVRPNQLHYGLIKNQPKNFLVSTGFTVIDVDITKAVPEYVYYVLTQNEYTEALHAIAEQSTSAYPSIRPSDIGNRKIPLPSLETQQKIAKVLSAIDDKIELNNSINKNLTQQMMLLYQKLSTQQPWKYVAIGEIAEKIAMGPFGSNIKVSTFVSEGVPIISGNHLRGYFLEEPNYNYITEEHAEKLKNSVVYPGDIIFTHAGNIGQVALIPELCKYSRYILSQRQFYLRCNRTLVLPEYVNLFFHSKEGHHELLSYANQTGVPSIAQPATNLKKIKLPLPNIKEQNEWLKTIKPLTDYYQLNYLKNEQLIQLRDTLLPKLMSGEIDVDKVEV